MSVCCVIVLLLTHCLSILAQPTGTRFPTCSNVTQTCTVGCREVSISLSDAESYSIDNVLDNVLCIDDDSTDVYRLSRCPTVFFNTLQNTSGVCTATYSDGEDLLLKANQLEAGLHPLDCLSVNDSVVFISAIVANDKHPYRDELMEINGVLQDNQISSNITLNAGDNFTMVTRAVGNVSVISVVNDERFNCATHFACDGPTDVANRPSNRLLRCTLRSAEVGDNGRILRVYLDGMELRMINITVNKVATSVTTSEVDEMSSLTTSDSVGIQTTSGTVQATPTSSSSNERGVDDGVIAAVVVTIVIIIVIVLVTVVVAGWIRKKRLAVRKKSSHDRKSSVCDKRSHETTIKQIGEALHTESGLPVTSTCPSENHVIQSDPPDGNDDRSVKITIDGLETESTQKASMTTSLDVHQQILLPLANMQKNLEGVKDMLEVQKEMTEVQTEMTEGLVTSVDALKVESQLKRQTSAEKKLMQSNLMDR